MPSKKISYRKEAQAAMEAGLHAVANAVKTTLGPSGLCVVIDPCDGSNPIVTKDGVTVAKHIELSDPSQNLGAQLCKQVSAKTNDVAGDGTTTATVLAQAMVIYGAEAIEGDFNPIHVKSGMDAATHRAIELLKGMASPVEKRDDIAFVASISGNSDVVGQHIAEAITTVGNDGVITIEENTIPESIVHHAEGMDFSRGYLSPYFINNAERMRVELNDPLILVSDVVLSSAKEGLNLLNKLAEMKRPLVVIAEDITGELLTALAVNSKKGALPAVAIKLPGFGQFKKDWAQDIAAVTGTTIVNPAMGMPFKDVFVDQLGHARRVVVTKDTCTIIDGGGSEDDVMARILQIKNLLKEETSDYAIKGFNERLGKLSGGVASIKVGASTDAEMKELKYRYEDALNATRAAISEGIVPGGGFALLRVSRRMLEDTIDLKNQGFERGYLSVCKALTAPAQEILRNAGLNDEVLLQLPELSDLDLGIDARTGAVVNMREVGIIDPVKVTYSALSHASSIAGLVLTTAAIIAKDPDAKPDLSEMMFSNGMGMGM